MKALPVPGGGFLLAGNSRSALIGYQKSSRTSPNLNRYGDIWLTRIGADGKALWDKAFNIPSDLFTAKNTLTDLIATRDGGFAFIATRQISGAGPIATAMLFKLGPDLSEQWQKPITVRPSATPKLCEMPDGSILVGTEQYNVQGKLDPRAVCFRADGSIRWDRSYTLEARKQFASIDLRIDKALVAGEGNYQFTVYYTTTQEGLATLLFRINADGLPQWEKRLAANGSATDAAADGSFLLVDNAFTPDGPLACLYGGCSRVGEVARIDRNGSVVWRKTLRRAGMSWNSIHTASRTSNGYLLGGITGDVPLGTETWVVKFDDSGTQKWDLLVDEDTGYQFAKSMSDAADPRVMSILPTADGGFFIGATRSELPTPGEPIDPDYYGGSNFMGIKVNSCTLTNGRQAAPMPLRPAKASTN